MTNVLWFIFFKDQEYFMHSPTASFGAFLETREGAINKALYYVLRYGSPCEVSVLNMTNVTLTLAHEVWRDGNAFFISEGYYIAPLMDEDDRLLPAPTRLSLSEVLERAQVKVWDWQWGKDNAVVRDDHALAIDDIIYLRENGWYVVRKRSELDSACVFCTPRF